MANIIRLEKDSNGNVILEERDDGYMEVNTYNEDNVLLKTVTTYPNGMTETEIFSTKGGKN